MATTTVSRKEQIINVAQAMFRDRGFPAASMREIAKEVGIEPSSLYSHFGSKDEILQHICFKIANEFMEVLDPIQNSVSSPAEKLRRLCSAHINVIVDHLDAASVFFHEWRHLKEPSLKKFVVLRNEYEDGFKTIVQEGITLCEFKNLNVDFAVRLIFSVLNDVPKWYKTSGKVTPDELGTTMSDFILKGIATA